MQEVSQSGDDSIFASRVRRLLLLFPSERVCEIDALLLGNMILALLIDYSYYLVRTQTARMFRPHRWDLGPSRVDV